MIRVLFDNTEIDSNNITKITQNVNPYGDYFTLGQTVCRQFTLNIKGSLSSPNKVYLYEDNGSSVQSNWTKFATLRVDDYSQIDKTTVEYSLTDEMVMFNKKLTYTLNDSVLTILNNICQNHGISLATQSFYMSNFNLSWSEEILERDFISYVAEVNGGYAYIDANGNLNIVSYNNSPVASINVNSCSSFEVGEQHLIDRVYVELASATKYYPSSSSNETVHLNPENILLTDSGSYTIDGIIQHIHGVINGFTFYNISIEKCPIQNALACQKLQVIDGSNNIPFICTINQEYNAKWQGGYELSLGDYKQEETKIESTKEALRRVNIKVDRESGEIRQEVSDLEAQTTASLLLKVDKTDNNQIISMINASADNIILNTKSLIFGQYPNGQYIECKNFALTDGGANVGVQFTGNGYVMFKPQQAFFVNNVDANDNIINKFGLLGNYSDGSGTTASALIEMQNKTGQLYANTIQMFANYSNPSVSVCNVLNIQNYNTSTGTNKRGNNIAMRSSSTTNDITLSTYYISATDNLQACSFNLSNTSGITMSSGYGGNCRMTLQLNGKIYLNGTDLYWNGTKMW